MQAPSLTCVLLVKTGLKGWQKILTTMFQDIEGLTFSIDVPNSLMYLHGGVDPMIFIKKLSKATNYAILYRIDYGYEPNPEGTRKPTSHFMRCVFKLNTLDESWYRKIRGALKAIQGVSFTIDALEEIGYLCGNIETGMLMTMLVKTGIDVSTIDYGCDKKDPNLKPPPKKIEALANGTETQPAKDTQTPPEFTCVLLVKTALKGWQKILAKILQDIEGLTFSLDVPSWLIYLHGEVDPLIFFKTLQKASTYALLYRIDYGYEENPEGTRKPNSHFMRCRFEINTLEKSWYKKIIGALKTIQGISFTIDAPTQMGYLFGNIETGVLMKMLMKTGIDMSTIDYGFDGNLKPPAKKLDAPANSAGT